MHNRALQFMVFLISVFALPACMGITPVKAWEKDTLGHKHMQIGGNPSIKKINEHVYTSKEASSGGGGIGGGGCGCN
ncbi:MAG: DUF4266 domain-containing protein [Sulfurovum sp.]|nr:DUF4266 domain-containing protein [Sulfurovum sp.]